MKAVFCTGYGSPDVLQFRDIIKPIPEDEEVLIKIYSTTVHIGDVRMRSFNVPRWQKIPASLYLGFRKPKRPVLGMELSGVVESVGKGVTKFSIGDRVFASTFLSGFGAHAEYKCIREDDVLATIPDNITFDEAAAGIVSGGLTALSALRKSHIQKGQKVLIYGASGSVGTYAVQLAHYLGAEVTGVCSTDNLELVSSLGADHVLDYTKEGFLDNDVKYDVIFDAVAKLSRSRGRQALKKNGVYLNVHKDSGTRKDLLKSESLLYLRTLLEKGDLKPVIDRTFSFDEIVEAHRYVEKGHKKGHVLIKVAD